MAQSIRAKRWAQALAGAPPINVLVYVDDDLLADTSDYGTNILRRALESTHIPIKATVRQRQVGDLTTALIGYDEVWFLLFSVNPGLALTTAEVAALRQWMDDGGGVLLAGDHVEPDGLKRQARGAPVGAKVPRARHLRSWRTPLWDEQKEVADSTETSVGWDTDPEDLEQDAVPQRLLLVPDELRRTLHPIFRGPEGELYDRLPDHAHEGVVELPEKLDDPDWPAGSPKPSVIARGISWRHGRTFALMAQWDGHAVLGAGGKPCGRILADASFHHYVDDNLEDLVDGDAWSRIVPLFINQAVWLAPKAIKDAYIERVFDWIQGYLKARNLDKSDLWDRGRRTLDMLTELLPAAWLQELKDPLPELPRVLGGELETAVLAHAVSTSSAARALSELREETLTAALTALESRLSRGKVRLESARSALAHTPAPDEG